MGSLDPRNVCTVSSSFPLSPFLFYFSLSSLSEQVVECEEEQPLPTEEEMPTPPSPPPETTPSPVAITTDTTTTPSSPKQQRRSKRKKRRRQRPRPVGGADEEDGGTLGRGEGAREEGEEESGDDLEFHDAHSELPGTILDYNVYIYHRESEKCGQKLANWLLYIHEGIRPCDAKREKMRECMSSCYCVYNNVRKMCSIREMEFVAH